MRKISKKRLMAMLIGICFVLSAGSAVATINIDTPDPPLVFMKEVTIPATGLVLQNPGFIMDVEAKFGFGANANEERYVRFDLSNGAQFTGAFANYTYECAVGSMKMGTVTEDPNGKSYIIINFTSSGSATALGDLGHFTIEPAGIKVFNTNPVTITYTQYKFPYDAQNQNNPLYSKSGTLITFQNALVPSYDAVTTKVIDVTTGSIKFVGGLLTSIIGDVQIDLTPGILMPSGAAATIADIIGVNSTLTVTGSFSACQNLDGTYTGAALQRVFVDYNGGCDNKDLVATSVAAAKTIFTFPLADITPYLTETAEICMEANGTTPISEGDYNATYNPKPGPSATLQDIPFTPGPISTLTKNGTEARITFLLTPDSMYKTYVRVTNPSETTGAVYLKLFKDDGTFARFNLNAVAGMSASTSMSSGALKARASTPLIPMTDIVAAAKVAVPTFDTTSGKLRLDAEAEFGTWSNSLDFAGDGVSMSAFSMMSDGTGFIMMPY